MCTAWPPDFAALFLSISHAFLGFQVDPNIPDGMKMIFLCSPNNPTGNLVSGETVVGIAESTDGIIFLDEAYAEFAESSLLKLVQRI